MSPKPKNTANAPLPARRDSRPLEDSVVVSRSHSFEVREDTARRAIERTLRVLENKAAKKEPHDGDGR